MSPRTAVTINHRYCFITVCFRLAIIQSVMCIHIYKRQFRIGFGLCRDLLPLWASHGVVVRWMVAPLVERFANNRPPLLRRRRCGQGFLVQQLRVVQQLCFKSECFKYIMDQYITLTNIKLILLIYEIVVFWIQEFLVTVIVSLANKIIKLNYFLNRLCAYISFIHQYEKSYIVDYNYCD